MVFEEKFYIGYSDINKDYGLSNTALLKFFENIAYMHSSAVHDGMKDTPSRWFLKAYHVSIKKRPLHEERVTVKTWSRVTKGVSAAREFELYDESGELCLTALSNWVRINGESFKPERIAPEIMEQYGSELERGNFENPWIGKIKEPETADCEKEFFVDRNFIDANNHMNNVFYLDLVTMTLPEEEYEKGEFSEFEIIYRKAAAYGEKIICSFSRLEDCCVVTVKTAGTGEVNAVIRLRR